jgi:hypothetical protein
LSFWSILNFQSLESKPDGQGFKAIGPKLTTKAKMCQSGTNKTQKNIKSYKFLYISPFPVCALLFWAGQALKLHNFMVLVRLAHSRTPLGTHFIAVP